MPGHPFPWHDCFLFIVLRLWLEPIVALGSLLQTQTLGPSSRSKELQLQAVREDCHVFITYSEASVNYFADSGVVALACHASYRGA